MVEQRWRARRVVGGSNPPPSIGEAMTNEAVFEARMKEPISNVHVSNSHGDIIEIYFQNGNKMYIWAYKNPHDLQAILIDQHHNIVDDFRDQKCKKDSDTYCQVYPQEGRTFVVTTS